MSRAIRLILELAQNVGATKDANHDSPNNGIEGSTVIRERRNPSFLR
jgi:hypothetical protein